MANLKNELDILEIEFDYYKSLSILEKENLLNKQYRKLALKFHPDRNPGDPSANENFQKLSTSYDALINSLASKDNFLLSIEDTNIAFNFQDLSFYQQDAILMLFEKLSTRIEVEDDHSTKDLMIRQNLEFLKLANKIQKNMSEFNEKRADALRDYMTNSTMYELFNK
ncbi:MAG: hypothetical protein EBY16_07265 [Gammaproteobacteria bacterium]|nr:hypothetical protein [Gammaproteobacteria bacterium]